MIVDASAMLALLFREAHADWVRATLGASGTTLVMSTVNLAEVLIIAGDRVVNGFATAAALMAQTRVRFVAPDATQAGIAARARLQWALNLGDCFAYALAVTEDLPIITLDADFRRCDRPIIAPPPGA